MLRQTFLPHEPKALASEPWGPAEMYPEKQCLSFASAAEGPALCAGVLLCRADRSWQKGAWEMLRDAPGGDTHSFSARASCKGFSHGMQVSSSAVRKALAEGRMDDVEECLGRPYRLLVKPSQPLPSSFSRLVGASRLYQAIKRCRH